ncbi:hypothetical protein Q1695_010114 [Nippostrongylus brasiliensis]|nr:hypothetical protein Q1695_010114 [Nippostrongylus brasiliensis]
MSGWDAYINTMTEASPAIKRAAIVGSADGSVWARTKDANEFAATDAELKKFVGLFDNLGDVPSQGVDLEDVHYIVPRTEENLIFGKKDKSGFFAAKTKTAVLIAVYEGENQVSAQAASVMICLDGCYQPSSFMRVVFKIPSASLHPEFIIPIVVEWRS